ncbi:MAG: transcription termination/antitermination protein NusG [bacterium]|nr:transcription termination/antitermination protein NusG [bacterium]
MTTTGPSPDQKRATVAPAREPRWYAIHTYSGYEDAVLRYLKQRVESLLMSEKIFEIVVPKEVKVRIKNGKRTTMEEKIYPGYVLVRMVMDHDSWAVVRNTPRVTGFVGADAATPTPLSKEEIVSLMARMGEKEMKFHVDLKVNEIVKITDGPFKDQEGKIGEVDEEHGKVKVFVSIFGRDTLVELDSLQVQKI